MDTERIYGVAGVLIAGGKVLLVIEKESNPAYCKVAGMFSVPAGTIEQGETPEETVLRDFAEETGIPVKIVAKLGVIVLPGPAKVKGEIFLLEQTNGHLSQSELKTLWMAIEKILTLPPEKVRPPTKEAIQRAIAYSGNCGP